MIIGSCGFGGTGSSVLTDLLSEYDNIQIYDKFEFVLPYRIDGLQDLEYHLLKQYAKFESGDYAIKRFLEQSKCYMTPLINKPCNGKIFYNLSKQFINSIIQIEYKGSDTADLLSGNILKNILAFGSKKVLMPKIIEKLTKKPSYLWPCRKMYYSIDPSNFYEEASKYIKNILIAMGADLNKPICLDQPFEGNNPMQSFKFFDDPYAIVIDRDPRDLYLDAIYNKSPDGKFYPRTNVKDFVIYYRNMRKNKKDTDRVIYLNFESFIYDYDNTVNRIEKFLNLGKHLRRQEVFDPNKSINNTQMIRLHPDKMEDIKYIENELSDYLFPFEKYPKPEFNGTPFSGSARNVTKF